MPTKTITVSLPVNWSEADKHLFEDNLCYEMRTLKVKSLKNVFVSHTGYCISKRGLVMESHHDYAEQRNNYLSDAYYHYYSCLNNKDLLVYLENNEIYLLVHHAWHNYYHWMTEVIPRLFLVKERLKNLIIILPERYAKTEYMMSSLSLFVFKDYFIVPEGKSLMIKNLCMPQIKPICTWHDSKIVNMIRKTYIQYINRSENFDINAGERIYISRAKASKRKLVNESDILKLLKSLNFNIICCEDYSYFQQVSLFSKAKFLVSIHGAGLTNMLFMRKGGSVMELHKKITNNTDHYSSTLWYLADALGHKYYHQICEPTDVNENYYTANFLVDINMLEHNLNEMLNKK